eukprot:11313143-Heterocapsa_arctica.AAC.1
MFDDKHYEDLLQLVRAARGDGCMMRRIDITVGLGVASPPSFGSSRRRTSRPRQAETAWMP